jgi:hypothetical protein
MRHKWSFYILVGAAAVGLGYFIAKMLDQQRTALMKAQTNAAPPQPWVNG